MRVPTAKSASMESLNAASRPAAEASTSTAIRTAKDHRSSVIGHPGPQNIIILARDIKTGEETEGKQ